MFHITVEEAAKLHGNASRGEMLLATSDAIYLLDTITEEINGIIPMCSAGRYEQAKDSLEALLLSIEIDRDRIREVGHI